MDKHPNIFSGKFWNNPANIRVVDERFYSNAEKYSNRQYIQSMYQAKLMALANKP